MTTPINLNKARKTRDRAAEKATADTNAAKFGRTKAQRVLEAAQAAQADNRLSQHEFEEE